MPIVKKIRYSLIKLHGRSRSFLFRWERVRGILIMKNKGTTLLCGTYDTLRIKMYTVTVYRKKFHRKQQFFDFHVIQYALIYRFFIFIASLKSWFSRRYQYTFEVLFWSKNNGPTNILENLDLQVSYTCTVCSRMVKKFFFHFESSVVLELSAHAWLARKTRFSIPMLSMAKPFNTFMSQYFITNRLNFNITISPNLHHIDELRVFL